MDKSRTKIISEIEKNTLRYQNLPYVWGGNSPSKLLSFLKNIFVGRQKEGNWRAGRKFEPGFDCSGWVQYNLRKAGFNVPIIRKMNCESFSRFIDVNGNLNFIIKKANKGDLILFRKKRGNWEHICFYLGNGMISECSGTRNISDRKNNVGGVQIDKLIKYNKRFAGGIVRLESMEQLNFIGN